MARASSRLLQAAVTGAGFFVSSPGTEAIGLRCNSWFFRAALRPAPPAALWKVRSSPVRCSPKCAAPQSGGCDLSGLGFQPEVGGPGRREPDQEPGGQTHFFFFFTTRRRLRTLTHFPRYEVRRAVCNADAPWLYPCDPQHGEENKPSLESGCRGKGPLRGL